MAQPPSSPGASRTTQIRAGEAIPVGEKTWVKRGHAARGNPAGLPRAAARLYALIGERVATSALGRVSGMGGDELASTLALLVERSLVVVETEVVQSDGGFDLDFTAPETLDRLRDEAERTRQAEETARLQVEAERRAKEEAEAKVRAEADAKARAEASARANAAALARLKAEKVERVEANSEINAREGALERARLQARTHADTLARAEAEARTRAEALRRAEAEAAARMAAVRKLEQDMRARMAALAKLEAARKQQAEAAARAEAERQEAERRAREEAEAAARAEAEARLDAERRAREEAEARLEAERLAREEAEAQARAQAERSTRAEAEARDESPRSARNKATAPATPTAGPLPPRASAAPPAAAVPAAAAAYAERPSTVEEPPSAAGPTLPGAEAPLQPLSDILDDFNRKAGSTLWDTADAPSFSADSSVGAQGSPSVSELGISVTSLADEVQRALEEAEARDRREQERRRPARVRRTGSNPDTARATTVEGAAPGSGGAEPGLPSISTVVPDEDPAVLEVRRLEREAEEQRLLAEEQARQRAREAAEVAARARAEREKSERRLEREHEQVQARAQALARERVDVEALREPPRPRPAWVRYVVGAAVLAALVGLPEVIPYGGPIPEIERKLSTATGQPASVSGLHFSLVPVPGFRLGTVTLGTGDQAVVLERVRVVPRLGSLLSGPLQVEQLRIASATVPLAALERLPGVLAAPAGSGYAVSRVVVERAQFGLPAGLAMPPATAQVDWSASGAIERASLRAGDGSVTLELAAAGGGFSLQMNASRWQAREPLVFQSLQMSARLGAQGLEDGRFTAEVAGGRVNGTVRASGSATAGLEAAGTAQLTGVDASALAALLSPAASAAGATDANLQFELSGKRLGDLLLAPRAAASFVVRQGWVGGVDLVLLIRDPSARGGRTVFDEWGGSFSSTPAGHSLRQMKLTSGPLTAAGTLDIGGDGRVSGRIASELQAASGTLRSNVTVSGTLREISAAPAN